MNRVAERRITALANQLNGMRSLTKGQWHKLISECSAIKYGFKLSATQKQRVEELEDLVLSKHKDIPK